jgi:ATP/maltotriose-dependent transcriptional regulator MalT
MRVALVGSPADRERVRAELNGTIRIVGEYATLAAARAAHIEVDAVILAEGSAGAAARRSEDRWSDASVDEDELVNEPLTSREIQVLELLAEGLPNKAIAARLGISDQTVKFHVASISGKLGAANRTDAVRRAVRRGLITL